MGCTISPLPGISITPKVVSSTRLSTSFPVSKHFSWKVHTVEATTSSSHETDAEARLYETINTVVSRGGKVIIPAFSVGRSQEVMLALEEGMRLEKIPQGKDLS